MNDISHSPVQTRPAVASLSDEHHQRLLQLSEQVGRIAEHLDLLGHRVDGSGSLIRFDDPESTCLDDYAHGGDRSLRKVKPPLPDQRLVRKILRHREMRRQFFEAELFGDPAWDILLDLVAARAEHKRVSVTSLCIASGVPPTTALRWIAHMTQLGLLVRVEDERDRRRSFVELSDAAADAMARYFAEMGRTGFLLI